MAIRNAVKVAALFDDTLMARLMRQGHRPNLMIRLSSCRVCDISGQLGTWCLAPFHECHLPGTLQLPVVREGTLVLWNAAALTPSQQSMLNDWILEGQGQLQIVSIATTRLETLVATGDFDDRLFYRLNTIRFDE